MKEPVKVSVLLTEPAVESISNLVGAMKTTRKDLIAWVTENYGFLYLDEVAPDLGLDVGLVKVQAEVSETFLKAAVKAMKCTEKLTLVSSLMNHLLTQDTIDGRMLGFPEPAVLGMVQEALRWFRFGPAVGQDPTHAIELHTAKILRLDRLPHGGYHCYGCFVTPIAEPFNFGFRGTIWQGELQIDVVLPTSAL